MGVRIMLPTKVRDWAAPLALLAIVSAACGTPVATPAAATAAPAAATAAPSAVASKTPAPTLAPKTARLVQAGDFLGWGPIYVAIGKDYFNEQNLKVEVTKVAGGALALTALLSGNADFSTNTVGEVLTAVGQGQEVKVVVPLAHESNVVCAIRPDLKLNLPNNPDWKQKAVALKGLKIGVTSIGGSVALTAKYILKSAGLDPDRDVQLTAMGVESAAWIAALNNKQIDAMCSGIPITQAVIVAKAAVQYISPAAGEVESLKGMTDVTVATTAAVITRDRDLVQRFVNALAKAMTYLQQNPADSAKIIKGLGFAALDQGAYDLGFNDFRGAFNAQPVMTADNFEKARAFYSFASLKPITVPLENVYDGSFKP